MPQGNRTLARKWELTQRENGGKKDSRAAGPMKLKWTKPPRSEWTRFGSKSGSFARRKSKGKPKQNARTGSNQTVSVLKHRFTPTCTSPVLFALPVLPDKVCTH